MLVISADLSNIINDYSGLVYLWIDLDVLKSV